MSKQIRRITDKEIPKTLYKYRSWDNSFHQKILSAQEIYFPKPSDFNDPFDGNIPIRWDKMTYEDCVQKNMEILNIMNKDKDQSLVRAHAEKVTKEKTLWHPDRLSKERPEQLDKWDSIIGLVSLTEISDSILMWSHYASDHTGFAVGFDTNSLSLEYEFDYIEPIVYQKEYPLISGLEDTTPQFHKKFFHKSLDWKYEKEWRISKNHIQNRVVKIKKKTFKELILGCRMKEDNKQAIIKMAKKHLGSHIDIYQAEKDAEDFKLNITKIKYG